MLSFLHTSTRLMLQTHLEQTPPKLSFCMYYYKCNIADTLGTKPTKKAVNQYYKGDVGDPTKKVDIEVLHTTSWVILQTKWEQVHKK